MATEDRRAEATRAVQDRVFALRIMDKDLCERAGIKTASYSRGKAKGMGVRLLAKVEKALDEIEAERASA